VAQTADNDFEHKHCRPRSMDGAGRSNARSHRDGAKYRREPAGHEERSDEAAVRLTFCRCKRALQHLINCLSAIGKEDTAHSRGISFPNRIDGSQGVERSREWFPNIVVPVRFRAADVHP
jgi:hypothetical protein